MIDDHISAGLLLILAFISFALGAALPLVGDKGNTRLYMLDMPDYLQAIARNPIAWRWANIFMGAAVLILLAGLTILTTLQEAANERILSRLGLVGFAATALLWVIFSAFRATVTTTAAHDFHRRGEVPTYYQPLDKWAASLFTAYAVIGFLSLAAYGGSLLQAGPLPTWSAWVTLILSLALLLLFLVQGDTLPAFHYLPPLLIGILLIILP